MMEYRPPTDNLYKFLAIAGVVILVASFYWPERFVHDLETRANAMERQFSQFQVAHENFLLSTLPARRLIQLKRHPDFATRLSLLPENQEEADALQHYFEQTNKSLLIWSQPVPAESLIEVLRKEPHRSLAQDFYGIPEKDFADFLKTVEAWLESEESMQWNVEFAESARTLRKDLASIRSDYFEIGYLVSLADHVSGFADYGKLSGVMLMIVGFSFWYWKVQRHQDAALRRQTGRPSASTTRVNLRGYISRMKLRYQRALSKR